MHTLPCQGALRPPAGKRMTGPSRLVVHSARSPVRSPGNWPTRCRGPSALSATRTPAGPEVLAEHGYPPLPEFEEPPMSPRSRPELARRFPLILTCAKSLRFCESQHRIDTPHGSVRARGRLNAGPRPRRRVRPARLVAGLCRAGPARLPAVRTGQRQPQPRPAPGTERPDRGSSPLRSSMCEIAPLPQDESTSA